MIRQLYLDEKKSLIDVIETMKEKHGFRAT